MTGPTGWTAANARHVAGLLWPGQNPAARVYESIGSDFFLAPAPGWLNLGLWDGPPADPAEGPAEDPADQAEAGAAGWSARWPRPCLAGA